MTTYIKQIAELLLGGACFIGCIWAFASALAEILT